MTIHIENPALEARIRKQAEIVGGASLEKVLENLLDIKEEQELWLLANRDSINAKIQRGIDELDAGLGIPASELPAYITRLESGTDQD